MSETFKDLLLIAPAGALDHVVIELIKKWDDEPTALQLLETLDNMICFGSASEFAVRLVTAKMYSTLIIENQTYDQLVEQAIWRNHL